MNDIAIDPALLAEAELLNVDVSRAAARLARSKRWQQENGEALEASNAYVESNGLPLASRRLF